MATASRKLSADERKLIVEALALQAASYARFAKTSASDVIAKEYSRLRDVTVALSAVVTSSELEL